MKKKKQAAALSPGGVKKLKSSLSSLFDKLESSHATLLDQAATLTVQQQLKKEASAAAAAAAAAQAAAPARKAPGFSSGGLAGLRGLVDPEEIQRRQERQQRFREEAAAAQQAALGKDRKLVEARAETGRARGQNQSLEKEYLRLTSLPTVADVRPPQVLRQALELVKHKWVQEGDYKYVCDQLKSIRQDLTVQHVRNALTLQVYETHARIAIEVGDWAEYKQCHSVLQGLYADGMQGDKGEFAAYGLLYAAAAGSSVLTHEMKEALADRELLDDGCVRHALATCSSFAAGDYVGFLRQYEGAPRMAPYLMDLLLGKLQQRAYGAVLAAYQPTVPLSALQGWLGLAPKALKRFLREKRTVLAEAGAGLDVKACRASLLQLQQGGAGPQCALVCKQWDAVLRGSKLLWQQTKVDLDKLAADTVPDVHRWLAQRAHGIRELSVYFSDSGWWSTVGFLCGAAAATLTRLELCGESSDCVGDQLEWLGAFGALQSLHLSNCLGEFHPSICRLTALRELTVTQSSDCECSFVAHEELTRLSLLSHLELRCCLVTVPAGLGRLPALKLLTLEAVNLRDAGSMLNWQLAKLTALEELGLDHSDLFDMPALSPLTRLTCLALPGCFDGRPWGRATWESKLQVLAGLSNLQYLDLSDNSMPEVPSLVAHLPKLSTLKVSLNPLVDGLGDGPWASLEHLDLHGSSICDLPDYLVNAQRLGFLGLACCHSLQLDRPLVERVLGRLGSLETITLCGSMLESVEGAKAMLTLGRMLPRVEVYSQDEVDESDSGEGHHHGGYSSDEEDEDGEDETDEDFDSEDDEFTDEDDSDY